MLNYVIISLVSGALFGIMDAVINANPLAQRLYTVYKPIAKTTLNPILGIGIDLVFGFAMAGVYWVLYTSLPGTSGLIKGISLALMMWFFRVVMQAASQWMMYKVPANTLLYTLFAGLGEMLILGFLYGLALKPL